MKKKLFILVMLSILLLPLGVFASGTSTTTVSCDKTTLKSGESTNCSLSVTTTEDFDTANISMTLTDMTVSNIAKVNFSTIDSTTITNISLTNTTAVKGTTKLITFTIKANDNITSGERTNTIAVTLKNGATAITQPESYNLKITVPVTDNTLKSLQYVLNSTKVSVPSFDKNTTKYSILADTDDENITFYAEATDSAAVIEILPNKGTTRKDLELGLNTFAINVYDGYNTAKLYTVIVNRKDPRELSSLKINGEAVTLTSGVYSYPTIKVANSVKTLTVAATLEDATDNTLVTDIAKEYTNKELKVGNNTVSIKIKNDDIEGERVYTVVVNRLDENGKDTTVKDTSTTTNPKTFGGQNLTIIGLILMLGLTGYMLLRKKSNFKIHN